MNPLIYPLIYLGRSLTSEELTSVLEHLTASRAQIASMDRWTKRKLARDSAGLACPPRDAVATCWCAQGAMVVTSPYYKGTVDLDGHYKFFWAAFEVVDKIAQARLGEPHKTADSNLVHYNDLESTSHQDIMSLFDGAVLEIKAQIVHAAQVAEADRRSEAST